MKNPKVSVIIPTYNRAHYLEQAIKSVLAQTFQDYELIILDNASTDNTPEVVRKFIDKRIKYVRNDINIGSLNNFNKGLEMASGDYVIIFHDDDIMVPQLIEKEVEILDEDKNVVLVAANISIIDNNGRILKKKALGINRDVIFNKYEFIYSFLKDNCALPCPTVMIRRNFINDKKIRFRSEVGPNADSYMWMEINLYDKKIYLLHEPLVLYRHHEAQESRINFFERNIKGYKYSLKLLKDNKLEYIIPYLKKNATYYLISVLSNKLAYGYINRGDFKEYINKIKEEDLWINDIKFSYKLRILLSYFCPKLAIMLHKIKMMLTNQKYY
jgi:glycosyltransferase involved in cell wall biosynthesis